MKVFVTGSRGFIGRHVVEALANAGHDVVRGVSTPAPNSIVVDFTHDDEASTWAPRLRDIDCVINTVGVIRSGAMASIHVAAPIALFAAAAERGVQVINVSALGADELAQTQFHLTKRAADDALLESHSFATVVLPSLVYGKGGASADMLTTLATLPVIPLPGGGEQRIQPIHVADLASALVKLVGNQRYAGRKLPLVGPHPVQVLTFLEALRRGLGLGPARFVRIPDTVMKIIAALPSWMRGSLVDQDTLRMLDRGNTASSETICEILGHAPRPVSQFIAADDRRALRASASLDWLLVLLRISIAAVWFAAGIVSAGVYPLAESVALVERTGITGRLAIALVYTGAIVDVLLGIATLVMRRKLLWGIQIAVIVGYTAIITIWLADFWLHPYGPIVKNLPMLAALYVLYVLEER